MDFRRRVGIASLVTLAAFALVIVPLAFAAGPFSTNLQLWDTGSSVLTLQQFLNAQGFIVAQTGAGSPGQETTTFGPHTYQALVQFQTAHGLPATGFFGPLTRTALMGIAGTATTLASSSAATSLTLATSSLAAATSSRPTLPYYPVPSMVPGNGYIPGFGGGGGAAAPAPTPIPTCNISASSTTITVGDSSTLTWSSTNGTSVSLSGIDSVPASGSQSVSPIATTTYTLTVANSTYSINCSATVVATPYIAQAVHFEPSNYISAMEVPINPNQSYVGTFSGWFRAVGADGPSPFVTPWQLTATATSTIDGSMHEVELTGPSTAFNFTNDIGFNLLMATGQSNAVNVDSDDGLIQANTWYHLFVSWNTDFSTGNKIVNMLINGVNVVDPANTGDHIDAAKVSYALDVTSWGVNYTQPIGTPYNWFIPCPPDFFGDTQVVYYNTTPTEVADYQFWTNQYIAPTPENLAKFISNGKPVNPAVAAAAFGKPDILLSGDAGPAGFRKNNGTVDAVFTLTGSLEDASTSPSN